MEMPIAHSFVTVQGRSMEYETSERGEFWRLLLPGNYTLRAFASGYFDEVQVSPSLANAHLPSQYKCLIVQRVSFGDLDMPVWLQFRLKKKNQRGEFLPPQVFNEMPFEFHPTTTVTTTTTATTTTTTVILRSRSNPPRTSPNRPLSSLH
jgi:hypothetical protein